VWAALTEPAELDQWAPFAAATVLAKPGDTTLTMVDGDERVDMPATVIHAEAPTLLVPDSEHGLSMCDPATGRVVIAVATTPHPMRQRSSIAHELGHVVAGDLDRAVPLSPGERSPEEISPWTRRLRAHHNR
jgi:uncharacterized protein YndB with AHSA1/START domain